jgi:putative ABC transport system substrate-binding protein
MNRREFIALTGAAAAAAFPRAARSESREPVRRVGVLMNLSADDPEGQARLAAFQQGLQEAGWAVGRNLRIDLRWGGGDAERISKQAAELVALAPDVILASTSQVLLRMREASRTIPIVFTAVTDPVASGFAASLARPGGNATGFLSAEYGMSAKWLELLKDIAPRVTRAAVLYDAYDAGGLPQYTAIQAVAPLLKVELTAVGLRDTGEIERSVAAFAGSANGGLVVTRIAGAIIHRDLIIALAARHRLPAVYPLRVFVAEGGLISYGPDIVDQHRRAAGYVDRILKGTNPADLPVQAPVKYEMVLNLKTAKALGLEVPTLLLARADEVIE